MTKRLEACLTPQNILFLSPVGKGQQRRSLAYGNFVMDNPRITRG